MDDFGALLAASSIVLELVALGYALGCMGALRENTKLCRQDAQAARDAATVARRNANIAATGHPEGLRRVDLSSRLKAAGWMNG